MNKGDRVLEKQRINVISGNSGICKRIIFNSEMQMSPVASVVLGN